MALEIGEKAPSFSLPPSGSPEERVSLEDAEGFKLVLLFFPLAFTSVCTDEACTISEELNEFRELQSEVLGISVDSPFAQQAWKQKEDFQLPLLSDFNRDTIRDYDVARDELMGLKNVSNRAAFVIDQEGVIRYSWESDDPGVLPPFEEIREAVESM